MSASAAPRPVLPGTWEASARRGGDAVLPCLVHANPLPAKLYLNVIWYFFILTNYYEISRSKNFNDFIE